MVQADSPSHWLPCTTPSTKHTESVVRSTACLRVVLGHMLVSIPKGEAFFLVTTGQCPDLPNAHMLEFDSCLLGRPAPWELSPNAKTAPFWVSRLQDAGTWAMGMGSRRFWKTGSEHSKMCLCLLSTCCQSTRSTSHHPQKPCTDIEPFSFSMPHVPPRKR